MVTEGVTHSHNLNISSYVYRERDVRARLRERGWDFTHPYVTPMAHTQTHGF